MLVGSHDGQYSAAIRTERIAPALQGLNARMSVVKGEKRIPLRSISAVQWKPAGFVVNGYIEFSVAGGNESRSKLGRATGNAVSNENAVVFTKKQMPEFIKLKEMIESSIANSNLAQPASPSSNIPDLIKELSSLHEQGILTAQEYEDKKSNLLKQL